MTYSRRRWIEEFLRGDHDLPAATVEALDQMAREAVEGVVRDAERFAEERAEHGDVPDDFLAEQEAQNRSDREPDK